MEEAPGSPTPKPAFEFAEEACPPEVAFDLSDGKIRNFRYADLREVRYDSSGMVRLRFASAKVVISGCNLLPLWRSLRSRRVRLVRVGAKAEELLRGEHEPHIDGITISPAPRLDT
jgi:hypothetical protein